MNLDARGVRLTIVIAASIEILVTGVARSLISKVGGGRLDMLTFQREDDFVLFRTFATR